MFVLCVNDSSIYANDIKFNIELVTEPDSLTFWKHWELFLNDF